MEFLKGITQDLIEGKFWPSFDVSGKITTVITAVIQAASLSGIVDANTIFTLILTIVSVTYVALKAYSMLLEVKERRLRIKNIKSGGHNPESDRENPTQSPQ